MKRSIEIISRWMSQLGNNENEPDINSVFHPTVEARGEHFIGRQRLLSDVRSILQQPGLQGFIYGPSGSGKSSLVQRALELENMKYIRLNVSGQVGNEKELLSSLWEKITGAPPGEYSNSIEDTGELKGGIPFVPGLGGMIASGRKREHKYVEVPRVDDIATQLCRLKMSVMIDDLEHLNEHEWPDLADLLKKNSDRRNPGKIFAIAAIPDVEKYFCGNEGAKRRTRRIEVSMFSAREQRDVSDKGFDSLGIETDDDSLRRLHYHSCGIPSVLHELCYGVAKQALSTSGTQRRIFPYIQTTISELRGVGTLIRSIEGVNESLRGLSSKDKLLEIRDTAVFAAMLVDDNVTESEIVDLMNLSGVTLGDISSRLEQLVRIGILEERIFGVSSVNARFRFTSYEIRLGLRWMHDEDHIRTSLRSSKMFAKKYARLSGLYFEE